MLLGEPEQIQCYDFGLRGDKNKRTGSMHIASFILREREREGIFPSLLFIIKNLPMTQLV